MYQIEYSRDAMKALKAMPRNIAALIMGKLSQVAESPMDAPNVKKLSGRPGYRLRVGDWRIIYELEQRRNASADEIIRLLVVLAIAPRGGIYQ